MSIGAKIGIALGSYLAVGFVVNAFNVNRRPIAGVFTQALRSLQGKPPPPLPPGPAPGIVIAPLPPMAYLNPFGILLWPIMLGGGPQK